MAFYFTAKLFCLLLLYCSAGLWIMQLFIEVNQFIAALEPLMSVNSAGSRGQVFLCHNSGSCVELNLNLP